MAPPTSKDTAVINNSTKRLEMTAYGGTSLDKLFSHSNIEVIYMDGVANLSRPYFFEFMNALKAAVFPDVTTIVNYVFWNDAAGIPVPGIDFHKKIDFPKSTPFMLKNAGANIILRSAEMCTVGFTASTWGVSSSLIFYVPQALLATYREANNWNTFGASRILPIEGSQYENVDWWKVVS